MATRVILPFMGLTTVEATVVEWLKQEGDEVRKDEPLVEVLTDKVATQVDAPESGVLLQIVAPPGAVVPVTNTLCWLGRRGEAVPREVADAQEPAPVAESRPEERPARPAALSTEGYVRASPAAKRLAREHGVDLSLVAGSGSEGRVVEEDVLKFVEARSRDPLESPARVAPPASVPPATAGIASTVPLAGLRRTIARRMAQSAQTVARVTLTTEVDATELVEMRERLAGDGESPGGPRVSYTDLVVKIVAHALRRHPEMNARLAEDEIQLLDRVNVGIAVAAPQGLVVPVVHDADRKELGAIARESREKVGRARVGTLTQEDVAGGTFTVTNLGPYEVDAFTPIVNLPEAAILGVGRIVEKPVVFQGEIAKRSMMFLSLSFDHRAVDGAPAAEFLRTVKQSLERPYTLLSKEQA